MSPSWRKQLHIGFSPDGVTLCVQAKGFRPALPAETVLPCVPGDAGELWRSPLQALEDWLQANPQAGSTVTVVLSNRLVRYAVLSWSDAVRGEAEIRSLAQAVLTGIYGEAAASWTTAAAVAGYGQPMLAAATDAALLAALRQLCEAHGLSLQSVRPWLTEAYSWLCPETGAETALFATEESGQLCLLGFRDGVLHSAGKEYAVSDDEITVALQRQKLLNGLPDTAPVYLLREAGGAQPADLPGMPGLHLLQPGADSGNPPNTSPGLRMTSAPGRARLRADFCPRRLIESGPAGWALLVVSLLLMAGLLYGWQQLQLRYSHQQKQIARVKEGIRQARDTASDPQVLEAMKRASGVIEQLAFPWGQLFTALESVATGDAVLLSVQPDTAAGTVSLTGEAKDWDAMLAYLRLLSEEQFFDSVQLVSHQVQQNDPQKPVRFVLQCGWGMKAP